jgi:hypothetical protein
MPDLSPPGAQSDFYFVLANDPETAVGRIIELVRTRIPKRFSAGNASGGPHGLRQGWSYAADVTALIRSFGPVEGEHVDRFGGRSA